MFKLFKGRPINPLRSRPVKLPPNTAYIVWEAATTHTHTHHSGRDDGFSFDRAKGTLFCKACSQFITIDLNKTWRHPYV